MLNAFNFPLNVYAWLLEREFGQVKHLHYGLFESPKQSALEAQERAVELLLAHLPAAGQILDVGCGVGSLLERLLGCGRQALGVNPDPAQVALLRQRLGEEAPVCISTLEAFDQQAGQWDAIIFHESAQYIDGLDLFEAAQRLLSDEGCILLLDEFATRQDENERPRLPHLPHFLRWAQRHGFETEVQLDVSAQAQPTLDWLLQSCQAQPARLCAELGLSLDQLAQLNASNQSYRQAYAAGSLGYFLLRLRRKQRPAYYPVRINTEAKAAQARGLFAAAFAQSMPPELWHWKYGQGRGTAVGVLDANGQMVAHYGGVERALSVAGRVLSAFCAADFMALQTKVALKRQGPAFLAAATFLEHELGYSERYQVGFGFPNKRAYALPARLGLYGPALTRMVEICLPALQAPPDWRNKIRPLDLYDDRCAAAVDACHTAFVQGLQDWKVPLRPYAWLRQRYALHPLHAYACFGWYCRWTGRLRALWVLRLHTDGRCELLDLVCDLRQIVMVLNSARRCAQSLGANSLFMWASADMLSLLDLPAVARVTDLDVLVPANAWTSGPAFETLHGQWWLLGGDTDCR